MNKYDLADEELHTAWILRNYLEQSRTADFEKLSRSARRAAIERDRNRYLLKLQQTKQAKTYRQTKKNFEHTRPYVHLTLEERRSVVQEVADCVAGWGFARLFAECIDKTHFDPTRTPKSIDEQAFEQVVSRFEQYLVSTDELGGHKNFGLLVHDNNETVARKHTQLMRRFHKQATVWTSLERLIETPLFVDSRLTSMVQIADLCGYALRRYLENNETDLLYRIFPRAHRKYDMVVGVRHFATPACGCDICRAHKPKPQVAAVP